MLDATIIARYGLHDTPKSLLTIGNPKTAKGEKDGYFTAILHLAPHTMGGFNVCGAATIDCIRACLNRSGHGAIKLDENGLNSVQVARIRRTTFFKRDRLAFLAMLVHEIRAHIARCIRLGLTPAIRLNGTSDLPWENIRLTVDGETFANIFDAFPDVQFYDYTKHTVRTRRRALNVPNYHLTFSYGDDTRADDMAGWARHRGNVAVVFDAKPGTKSRAGGPLPATWRGLPVIDGDLTDLRFTDPRGVIVGLRLKGNVQRTILDDLRRKGFVQSAA